MGPVGVCCGYRSKIVANSEVFVIYLGRNNFEKLNLVIAKLRLNLKLSFLDKLFKYLFQE